MEEVTITLNLSEYEASVLNGALIEFAEKWGPDEGGASAICGQLYAQLPAEWEALPLTPHDA